MLRVYKRIRLKSNKSWRSIRVACIFTRWGILMQNFPDSLLSIRRGYVQLWSYTKRNLSYAAGFTFAAVFLLCTILRAADNLSTGLKGVSKECPSWILDNQAAIEVQYLDFDGNIRTGIVIADFRLAEDIQSVFHTALESRFPVRQIRPISNFGWDDFASMEADNTSAFNYRSIPFSTKLSYHAYGCAIDINPRENPYYKDGRIYPEGASYDVKKAGTFSSEHPIVREFKTRGWRWGGDWKTKDYHHFDKWLPRERAAGNKKYYSWK